ncbi:hypothetical protein D8B26_007137 [Coccidioides posadasii str. Silveira]|uniref:Uncharacterized protein n=1 Tax=Coccidioides posadasii (strain RMSCC 757 / Silveira) TaxID=443226 RepID=E9D4E1_COCPS|nr:conserved hypothetical protein [Coccidioides posadasii str. Silveira]QVM12514.1 hypothetical protein D8B26_007137 [Coccidioides posadasii str. Silveira]
MSRQPSGRHSRRTLRRWERFLSTSSVLVTRGTNSKKRGIPEGAEIPALITTFCECVATANPRDYSALQRLLQASPLDLGMGFIGQWESDKASRRPALLYDALHLQVEKIGKEICLRADDAPGLKLLRSLSEVMELYMSILLQKRMTRQHLLPKPYDLPSRLWRDLRWYLAAVADMTVEFLKVVIEMIYGFMAALFDVVPCYRLQYTYLVGQPDYFG